MDPGNQMRSIMLKAKIELQRKDDGCQVKDTAIDYDGQEVQRLGAIDQAKRCAQKIRGH